MEGEERKIASKKDGMERNSKKNDEKSTAHEDGSDNCDKEVNGLYITINMWIRLKQIVYENK